MIFKLENGYRVVTSNTADAVEFVTKNAAGETISSVTKSGEEADGMLSALRVANSIRFARQFGGRVNGAV